MVGYAGSNHQQTLLRAKQALSQLSYSPIVSQNLLPLIRFRARRGEAKHTESMRALPQ